jgi:uncharacterized phage-associated protein
MSEVRRVGAHDVGAALLSRRPDLDRLQLHKLLYLSQAASLAWFDEPLIRESFEAWRNGPVQPGVESTYKDSGDHSIGSPRGGDPDKLTDRGSWIVGQILDRYGHHSGSALADLVKGEGSPWLQVRSDLPKDASSRQTIPDDLIRAFHRHYGVTRPRATTEERALASKARSGDAEALKDLAELVLGKRPSLV